ncbi:hypothetical protein TanjilG_09215 [Lupinus angustifolius]|uniref:GOLD domain-containing protein n=1 Tax=Lupinus angustifolius TaxID=3871 RepID=A0A4P1QWR9_LUPAN|nr:PREDICTED: transmembrane emp24 domain-containing protein p24delta3-like [Lupinus angustifolius]XP_019417849.1 PREDICTED: transmembrane emp24 domain-containing protein p24delta3-like [Lupinus angustifolius]OIV96673.1 hypothetical protein TanjilG_09215 [Lupinus angustifolius]
MAKDMNLRSETPITLFLILLLSLTTFLLPQTEAIWLTIPTSGPKCLSEEIQSHVVVIADYYVVADDTEGHQLNTISAKVTSPYGNNLHDNQNVTHGQFAFTTTESGNYVACFWVEGNHQGSVTVSLEWRTGISAKDWEAVAKKEKIEGVELELRKLEGVVDAIHENLLYLKNREAEMREVSEATNGRVAWFSIMSLGVCISVSGLQLWYLKRFFRKKKLI